MHFLFKQKNIAGIANNSCATLFTCLALLIMVSMQCNPAGAATWSNRYYTPDNAPVEFNDVISVSGGGQLAVGKVWDSGTKDTAENALIVRFDQNGQVLWNKHFTFSGRWNDQLNSVVECSDGGFIAVGKALLTGSDIYGNPGVVNAILILKVDQNGNLLWSKLLNNRANTIVSGNRVKATTDGNYIIVGQKVVYQQHNTGVYSSVAAGALVIKVNTNGQILFSREFYGDWTHSHDWSFNDIIQDSDGSYYATGTASVAAYSNGVGLVGMLLVKLDSSGNLVWAKKYDYAQNNIAVGVNDFGKRILLSGNTLYVTGITYTLNISSFTLAGVRNWTKQYTCNRSYDTGISDTRDFIHSSDGNFFVTTSGGCLSVTKINPQGTVLWSKNTSPYFPLSLTLEDDNGFILGGWSDVVGTARGGTVRKYDSTGKSCQDAADIVYTVDDFEMITSTLSHETTSFLPGTDAITAYSGPALSVDKECEDAGSTADDNKDDDDDDGSGGGGGCFIHSIVR